MNEKLKVSEIFNSIQGEGPYAGLPATFVRFAGCNLSCPFCDSKYAWSDTSHASEYGSKELAVTIADYRLYNGLVVITGGEPVCQNDSLMFAFIQQLRDIASRGGKGTLSIHVETNGSSFCEWMRLCDHVVVSLKSFDDITIFETLHRRMLNVSLKLVVSVDGKVVSSIKVSLLNEAGLWLGWSLPYILSQRQFHFLKKAFVSPIAPVPFDLTSYLYKAKQIGNRLSDPTVVALFPYPVYLTLQLHKLMWGGIQGR